MAVANVSNPNRSNSTRRTTCCAVWKTTLRTSGSAPQATTTATKAQAPAANHSRRSTTWHMNRKKNDAMAGTR